MALNLSSFGATFLGWGWTMFTWLFAVIVLALLVVAGLYLNKSRRFNIPVLEVIGTGRGKVIINSTYAGWFKKNTSFMGLIETGGERVFIVKDGNRRVFNVSSEDYHEINGKKGLIVKRKDDDPEILVPLSEVEVSGLKMLSSIAPADYRDVAVEILAEKKREAFSWWDENKSIVVSITLFVIMMVVMIVFFKFMSGESEGWRSTAERIFQGGLTSNAP